MESDLPNDLIVRGTFLTFEDDFGAAVEPLTASDVEEALDKGRRTRVRYSELYDGNFLLEVHAESLE